MYFPDHFVALVRTILPEPHASILNGMLFGTQLTVTPVFRTQLNNAGLIHIVVLSGMNISLVASSAMYPLIRIFGRRLASMITICIIIAFVLSTGIQAPAVRAGIMAILSFTALLLGRKTISVYVLGLTSFIMICINPSWLASISFQLSCAATLGIILFGNVINSDNNSPTKHFDSLIKENFTQTTVRSIIKYSGEELRITIAAQVFTLPIIFWYFRDISLIAPVSNLLVGWMIAPLTILGYSAVCVAWIFRPLGFILMWPSYVLLELFVWIVRITSSLPASHIRL